MGDKEPKPTPPSERPKEPPPIEWIDQKSAKREIETK